MTLVSVAPPAEDDPTPSLPEPSVTTDTTTVPPVVASPPVAPPIEAPPVVAPLPVTAGALAGPLGDLLGRITASWTFSNTTRNSFTITANFGPENLTDANRLAAIGATTGQLGGGPVMDGEPQPVVCSFLDPRQQFLCIVGPGTGELSTNMLFDRPVGGSSTGTFATCDSMLTSRACALRLLREPFGPATLRIDSLTTAISLTSIGPDLAPYLAYEAQSILTSRSGRSEAAQVDAPAIAMDATLAR